MNMREVVYRFKFFDMPVRVQRSALVGTGILIVIGTALAIILTPLTPLDALMAGILAMLIYWFSDIMHQYGHFIAAKMLKKPATALSLWWFLSTPSFPANEGNLPPQLHIRRAIGGPVMSIVWLILFLLLGTALWSFSPMARFIAGWAIYINASILLISLTPLDIGGFVTDGMTILRAYRQQRDQH